jgi:hypothetical protein
MGGGGGDVGAFCASAGIVASRLAPRSKESKRGMKILLEVWRGKLTAF